MARAGRGEGVGVARGVVVGGTAVAWDPSSVGSRLAENPGVKVAGRSAGWMSWKVGRGPMMGGCQLACGVGVGWAGVRGGGAVKGARARAWASIESNQTLHHENAGINSTYRVGSSN